MSEHSKLELEILTGPLDGHVISLATETEWTCEPGSLLSFPWDKGLGTPQATFALNDHKWILLPHNSPHNTYRLNLSSEGRLNGNIILTEGDILKASQTWLWVKVLVSDLE